MSLALISNKGVLAGLRVAMGIGFGVVAASSHAMVPASERAVLDAIWFGTGGQLPGGTDSTWTNRGGWGIPVFLGISECGSYGVTCVVDQGQEHISAIELGANGLTGQLPPSLSALPYLVTFSVNHNAITGQLPGLSGLTKLVSFDAGENQFGGGIPSLAGLVSLEKFNVGINQLTGAIPPLSGLASLQLLGFHYNHLTGPIPSLAGLANLQMFVAAGNQLTGSLPSLTNMTSLFYFDVGSNSLEGMIPSLGGLPNLEIFSIRNNRLSGPIPNLSDLTSLVYFVVDANQLTGLLPAAPATLDHASLCPNRLEIVSQPAIDPLWNAATATTPWWATPTATNICDELFLDDFEFSGGGP